MNIKRSYFQGLLAAVGVGLLLTTNCTIKESDDDGCKKGHKESGCKCSDGSVAYQVCNSEGVYGSCVCDGSSVDDTCDEGDKKSGCSCEGNVVGYQVCDGDGVYGSCVCPAGGTGGTGNDTGGTANDTGGAGNTSNGGSSGSGTAAADAGGAGGEGGAALLPDFGDDCELCLATLCENELNACLDDPACFDGDGNGQYERIATCVNDQRAMGLVKRDVMRACGVNLGSGPTNPTFDEWAPEGMADSTTNLLNCMATSSSEAPNADWANDVETNYPEGKPVTPWPADSCAKLACTSQQ